MKLSYNSIFLKFIVFLCEELVKMNMVIFTLQKKTLVPKITTEREDL